MPPVLKTLLAIVGGIIAGGLATAAVQKLSHMAFGVPEMSSNATYDEIAAIMDQISLAAKLGVVVSWAAGMAAASYCAAFFAVHKSLAAATALAVMMTFTVMNFYVIPHPTWMMVAPIALGLLIWLAVKRYCAKRET